MYKILSLLITCCLALALSAPRGECKSRLVVDGKGVLMKDGKPYRGVGVNYWDAFYHALGNPGQTRYQQGFAALKELGIPYCRFMAGGFWPNDWRLYLDKPAEYFAIMDAVVKSAEENGIGLIPSLFWSYAAVPDIVGEPMDQWADPKSKTQAFMRRYVKEVVTRYANSPAIWGWEFGNEYNLAADLPNASEHRPKTMPKLGTPTERGKHDELTHLMIRTACQAFAREVRKYDSSRIITSGNSFPRPSAWHQRQELSWTADTREQYLTMLLGDNPGPIDVCSGHLYPNDEKRFGGTVSYEELLKISLEACNKAGKSLFVGEFGAGENLGPDQAHQKFTEMLTALEKVGIPLAAVWDFSPTRDDKSYIITSTNSRAYQLTAIAEANKRLAAGNKEP